ncbi:head-tail connector protein [Heyndrickxia oleronia]|uniref:head-tail connector protein n=1 Tax=Heyndrickxia oleronia TaxID=38875 RepID=UPI0021B48536|nr:head-tail connector protein [Heyndrickxia oleronia]
MAVADNLLPKVKANLILMHDQDDALLIGFITAAVSYAQSYQHVPENYYETHAMPSNNYESRDGSTAGFFADSVQAGQQVWNTVNLLLRLDREWGV